MKDKIVKRLGERELDIMQALWSLGKATVTEVQMHLREQGEEIAYTTVQTMLNRLEAKRLVARDDSDRTHYYRARFKEPFAVNAAVKRISDRFFKGSVEALAVRLIEKDLDAEQLKRLQSLINAQSRKEKTK
jgi:BlaI family transcriptional regulator, penicillinase repressor